MVAFGCIGWDCIGWDCIDFKKNLMKIYMNKYLVEFLGTVFFIFVIITVGHPLAIGAALTIAIILGGPISGGNFNPAVSIMSSAAGKLPMKDLVPYILAQLAGALFALELSKKISLPKIL